ncbi:hypothetical protein KUTeg_006193 [Tegillarca granosa]|uniref:HTH psq-type domain-containing protein n=1 Tax=Tegillarca granosa TaxID=220873 RepID=A0ABQ9FFU5_TEGGR|nr:hypothetical protein KUTeg_006193 [Tegillarca granosa]
MQYERANLQRAYNATLNGMSVYRAARMYLVPESTLRDRTRGKVEMDLAHCFHLVRKTSWLNM